jgi:hypothetical protein
MRREEMGPESMPKGMNFWVLTRLRITWSFFTRSLFDQKAD